MPSIRSRPPRHDECNATDQSVALRVDDDDVRAYLALFEPHGGTAEDYLRTHYGRYRDTQRRLSGGAQPGAHVLDIGAHWLHQSLMYARAGCRVTAVDLPPILDAAPVRALAQAYAIRLLPTADLEHPEALRSLPEDSVDTVLFTEVIEHLTFNPVAMWREIYRVLRPGGRIVVTTPNYYALRRFAPQLWRFARGDGGGVDTRRIFALHTLAHHWKEYSLRELRSYFAYLSPDFACRAGCHVERSGRSARSGWKDAVARAVERCVPLLRPQLYLEIELRRKHAGIVLDPHW